MPRGGRRLPRQRAARACASQRRPGRGAGGCGPRPALLLQAGRLPPSGRSVCEGTPNSGRHDARGNTPHGVLMAAFSGTSHVTVIEMWLAAEEFEPLMADAYSKARGGTGSNDRNISPGVLEAIIEELHGALPPGLDMVRTLHVPQGSQMRGAKERCANICCLGLTRDDVRSRARTRILSTTRCSQCCPHGSRSESQATAAALPGRC